MQQINLYQPIFKKQEKIFSAVTMLQASLLFIVGLGLVWGYTYLQTLDMRDTLAAARKQNAEKVARLAQLSQQYPPRQADPQLNQQLQALQEKLAHRRSLIGSMQLESLGNRNGFSAQLHALASQDIDPIWLSRIQFNQGGGNLVLEGHATAAHWVPNFLQRLGTEAAFAGATFQSFVAARSEERRGEVDFTIRSKNTEGEG